MTLKESWRQTLRCLNCLLLRTVSAENFLQLSIFNYSAKLPRFPHLTFTLKSFRFNKDCALSSWMFVWTGCMIPSLKRNRTVLCYTCLLHGFFYAQFVTDLRFCEQKTSNTCSARRMPVYILYDNMKDLALLFTSFSWREILSLDHSRIFVCIMCPCVSGSWGHY